MDNKKNSKGQGPSGNILDLENPISPGTGTGPDSPLEPDQASRRALKQKRQSDAVLEPSPKRKKKPQKKQLSAKSRRRISQVDRERLVSLYAPYSPQGKRIDILRSQLLYPFHGDPPRIVMVSSSVPGEGSSLLASNLAVSFARGLQQYVLVIDCNLLRPVQGHTFGVPERPGLSDYLENGNTEVQDVIHWSKVDKLSVIPGGHSIAPFGGTVGH